MAFTFESVIGLEIHAQVNTNTKMFCSCSNDSFGLQPNKNVCPICMGFPGMLPVINKEVVKKGLAAALALHCEIPAFSKFDRKNYFYPDLPKGFQISQYDKPVSQNGHVDILINGEKRKIRVNRLHLEDDAGKLVHVTRNQAKLDERSNIKGWTTGDYTLCDYNRSGSPLMEIVSEPDMRSVEEASAYAQEVRRILKYVGSSKCDMEKGMMRFDINVSLKKKGQEEFGVKAEVKNLNSFRALELALAYEIKRQEEVLNEGGKIAQETRGWDDEKGETVSQRSKEEAHDYRYFPEPDLPPLTFEKAAIEKLKLQVKELPLDRKLRFMKKLGLSDEDAGILIEEKDMADYFEIVVETSKDSKKAVSFMNTILLKHLNNDGTPLAECKIKPEQLGKLIKLVNDGVVSNNMAKTDIFEGMYASGKDPEKVVEEKGLKLVSDTGAIEGICKKVLEENPGPVADFKGGKQQAFGFLVGQAMKASKGQGNPKIVNEILRKLLS
ncbi:Asp-tRNA(Asn)/Glu-tRNA(Gln) amidotransferase subunit GatB [Candidatus Peregrinibacteria bacterium]|nr:Asp-tRNA(Asn)/Glu-tRNA(Gln) amidotransferase subunit GatB [Candidatus Peregrinibacteria bacterium]